MITVILTGGKSRRMGRDKATLPINGTAMSLLLAERFEKFGAVYFSVNCAGRFPTGKYGELADSYPGQGPLNGIVSAFRQTDADMILMMATDMPACTPEAAQRLIDSIGNHDACIYNDEPLFGLYKRECYQAAKGLLEEKNNAMRGFLSQIDTLHLSYTDEDIFKNLNTPDEYEKFIKSNEI